MLKRELAAGLIFVVAAAALYRLVVVPWRCNQIAGHVQEATDRVRELSETHQARSTAQRNLERLGACPERCPSDVSLAMLAASNYRLLNRNGVAATHLQRALRYEPRAEVLFELGQNELALGRTDDALRSFVRAGKFGGTTEFGDIADPVIRRRAFIAVGAHEEEVLKMQGRWSDRDVLKDAEWRPVRGGTIATDPAGLHVTSSTADGGIELLPRGEPVPRAITTAWILVRRGRVFLGSGNGDEPFRLAWSATTGQWEKLEVVNETCPVEVTTLGAGPEGADFLVREVRARATLAAPPCGQ